MLELHGSVVRRGPSLEKTHHASRVFSEFLRPLAAMLETVTTELQYRRDIARLNRLPDHMLHDIGVSRGNIDYVIRCGDRSQSGIAAKSGRR